MCTCHYRVPHLKVTRKIFLCNCKNTAINCFNLKSAPTSGNYKCAAYRYGRMGNNVWSERIYRATQSACEPRWRVCQMRQCCNWRFWWSALENAITRVIMIRRSERAARAKSCLLVEHTWKQINSSDAAALLSPHSPDRQRAVCVRLFAQHAVSVATAPHSRYMLKLVIM